MCFYCHQVLFSVGAEEKIQQLANDPNINDERKKAAFLLQNTIDIINQVHIHHYTELWSKSIAKTEDVICNASVFFRLLEMPFLTCCWSKPYWPLKGWLFSSGTPSTVTCRTGSLKFRYINRASYTVITECLNYAPQTFSVWLASMAACNVFHVGLLW